MARYDIPEEIVSILVSSPFTLEKLNERKATGYDGIPPKIMKIGAAQLSSSLAILFNSCINNRKWPSQWKRGEWIPTFKRDDAQAINNYRPITVLPCVDKVFEQLLGKQISDKFESQLADCQSAYRKYRSCETTLVGLVEDWKKSKDEGLSVGILSTDMSKAFDSVHRPLLLSKLKSYGFNDSFVNMLNSYLSDRYNRVRLGSSVTSGWKSVVRGCPQGSSLGPLIWNIFQNDLVYNIDANISMYADDHQIYQTGKGISTVHTKLEESASSATDWYENNLLEGNLKKYQTMFIQNKYGHKKEQFSCTEHNTNLNLNGKIIRTSDSLKILGVTIDNKLNFNEHINDVCNKASQRVGVIMRLRNLIPTTAKLVLFKSAILPYLTYCHLVWHFCRASDTRRLERIQERGLRAVYKDTKSSYHQLLNRANLPTLLNRRLQDICVLMYKVKHTKMCSEAITNIFKPRDSCYSLRNSDFLLPRFNTVSFGKHSLRYLGPILWSKLDKNDKTCKSLSDFRNRMRNTDLTSLIDDGCKGCLLCDT